MGANCDIFYKYHSHTLTRFVKLRSTYCDVREIAYQALANVSETVSE